MNLGTWLPCLYLMPLDVERTRFSASYPCLSQDDLTDALRRVVLAAFEVCNRPSIRTELTGRASFT